jgi:serine protease Do
MLKRYILTAFVVVAIAIPAHAQRKDRGDRTGSVPAPSKTNPTFLALFKPAVETPGRSTVRVQVDGKDAALGTVVSEEGYVLTKASEIKSRRIAVKTRDGRDFDAVVMATSDLFDLVLLKVDGTGLVPVKWGSSADALVGNWVAVAGLGAEPVAVGVVSTKSWTPPGKSGPPVPIDQAGFLGVAFDAAATRATIGNVTTGSAAEKAGIQPKDTILLVDTEEILDQESLINTLQTYKAGEKVKVVLEREGKRMELAVVLGKRSRDQLPPKGSRGDFQNSMGSALSERRRGIPRFFQTDAVIKPSDCGAPLVDLDSHVLGLTIARAGRTESHVIPAETVKELVPVLMAAGLKARPPERVMALREALKGAEEHKAAPAVIDEAKRLLQPALADEKWWNDHTIESAPQPRVVIFEQGPAPRAVKK